MLILSLLPWDSSAKLLRLHQHKYWGIGPSSPITQECSAIAFNVILCPGSAQDKYNNVTTQICVMHRWTTILQKLWKSNVNKITVIYKPLQRSPSSKFFNIGFIPSGSIKGLLTICKETTNNLLRHILSQNTGLRVHKIGNSVQQTSYFYTLSYVSCSVSPRNGYRPSTIQYKVTPTAHVSAAFPRYVRPVDQKEIKIKIVTCSIPYIPSFNSSATKEMVC